MVVATADPSVAEAVTSVGGQVVWTRSDHLSGSDRVAEAVRKLGLEANDLVVNVQGDEPFLNPTTVEAVVECLQQGADAATAAAPLEEQHLW